MTTGLLNILVFIAGETIFLHSHAINVVVSISSADGKSAEIEWSAVDNDTSVFYGVDTYVGDTKVDIKDGITDVKTTIDRLSPGVEYTFKVYVSEKGDSANSMSTTGNNKTYVGEAKVTTAGEKDTTYYSS